MSFDFLEQLRQFLTTFSDLTSLMSENSPNQSLIPLIHINIAKACQTSKKLFQNLQTYKNLKT